MKINEAFYTIQGEGKNAGRAALFIRLPFCNLSCPWCDTTFDTFVEYRTEEVEALATSATSKFAVITGGEPSMNKQVPDLIKLLKKHKFEIAMESNGQFPTPDGVDHLTISPKRWTTKTGVPGKNPPFWFDPSNRPSELKFVFDGEMSEDTLDAAYRKWEEGAFQFRGDPLFYVSPEWGKKTDLIPRIVKYVQENPQWKISIQSHKVMNVR